VTRFTLHVPEALNDGTPVGPESFDLIENALLIIGGGFTLTHGIGAWRGDGGRTTASTSASTRSTSRSPSTRSRG
jgi:hypothetical protein